MIFSLKSKSFNKILSAFILLRLIHDTLNLVVFIRLLFTLLNAGGNIDRVFFTTFCNVRSFPRGKGWVKRNNEMIT